MVNFRLNGVEYPQNYLIILICVTGELLLILELNQKLVLRLLSFRHGNLTCHTQILLFRIFFLTSFFLKKHFGALGF